MFVSRFSSKAHSFYNFLHLLEPKVEYVRLSGPYTKFGPNKIVENVSKMTNKLEGTTLYKITHLK